ncbi:MAG: hypothetical protein JSR33_01455 [Proteobacteria bacterium]|nr:hypothetical protein [Pseudomonadota bacterium]
MKKIFKMVVAASAAALLVSTLSFADTTDNTQQPSDPNMQQPATGTTVNSTGQNPTNASPNTMNTPNTTVGTPGAAGTTSTTTGGTVGTSAPTTGVTTTTEPQGVTKTGTVKVMSTPVTKTVTVTVQRNFRVCYHPAPRHVTGTRIVERCGAYGCRQFRITREFDVTKYEDCHISKVPCNHGYRNFGVFPTRDEARDAVHRCMHTMSGAPGEWRVSY